jgi:hypothetical protein
LASSWTVALRRGRVDLRPRLVVENKELQADAGRRRRLAVLPRNLLVSDPESPGPVGVLPAEDAADNETLPRLQMQIRPGPFALGVFQALDEPDRRLGFVGVEPDPAPAARLDVADVTLGRLAHVPASDDLARSHALDVGGEPFHRLSLRGVRQ